MYCHDNDPNAPFQGDVPVVLRLLPSSEQAQDDANEVRGDSSGLDLDPLATYVLNVAYRLIALGERITIKELIEEVPAGESAIRDRLNQLVDIGKLECIPGSGRRPTYYYLPRRTVTNSSKSLDSLDVVDEEVLERIKDKELALREEIAEIQRELESVIQDREALEKAIVVRRKYTGK